MEQCATGTRVIEKVLKQLRPVEHKESMHGHSPIMDGCHPLMNLLVLLSKQNMLPAIIFNFNRAECEHMGEMLLNLLEELEGDWILLLIAAVALQFQSIIVKA